MRHRKGVAPRVTDGWRAVLKYRRNVLALILVALSLGLSNFAASVALGMSGVDAQFRTRVAVVFGIFEVGMPLVGLVIGHHLAGALGGSAKPFAGALLGFTGAYAFVSGLIDRHASPSSPVQNLPKLVSAGLALSVDNLAVGFALGTYNVNPFVAVIVIGAVSVGLSLIGLEFGNRLGVHLGKAADLACGMVLVFVGVAIGTGAL